MANVGRAKCQCQACKNPLHMKCLMIYDGWSVLKIARHFKISDTHVRKILKEVK